jgi:hypothetical protein
MRPVLPAEQLPRPFIPEQCFQKIPLIPIKHVDAVVINQKEPAQKKETEEHCRANIEKNLLPAAGHYFAVDKRTHCFHFVLFDTEEESGCLIQGI